MCAGGLVPTTARPGLCEAKIKCKKKHLKMRFLLGAPYAVRALLNLNLGIDRACMRDKIAYFRFGEGAPDLFKFKGGNKWTKSSRINVFIPPAAPPTHTPQPCLLFFSHPCSFNVGAYGHACKYN